MRSLTFNRHEVHERAQVSIALITVQDQADRAALALEDGFLSQSSKQSRYGKIKTLCDIAAASGNSLFPLELSVIRQVAGVMLKAGYRSVDSYLAAARSHNSELGYILPESLKHWMKGADRAARRGQGRSAQGSGIRPGYCCCALSRILGATHHPVRA